VPLTRAYALLTIKGVDPHQRTITGIASTPEPDRMGDIVEPLGVTYKNPLPLLLYHDAKKPVGQVTFKKPTADGLEFSASLPTIDAPGTLRDRVEEAWQSLKAGLLAGVSIGFRSIEEAFNKDTGGFRFLKTEVLELSLVAIPANADATIHTIKELDLAAPGRHPSRDRDTLPIVRVDKDARPMEQKTINEQITSFETSRAAKHARMTAIMTKSADAGATLDQAETDEYDGLTAELKAIDAHLVRLKALEATAVTKATPITAATPEQASLQRSGVPIISVKANVAPGTAFIRYCQALAVSRGSTMQAVEYAKRWQDSTPEVELVLKAAVAAGTTTDASWAGPLAPMKPLTDEFLALLRPATILGKVPGFVRVPFNVSVASQTGGGTYQWVGQGAPKPVGKLAFATITLGVTKCAGIIVITEELARTSTPSAEEVIRRDMVAGIAAYLDQQFIDPAVAAVAGVAPANARTDVAAMANAMTALNISTAGAVLVLSETNALAFTNALNPLGQPLFPAMSQQGGTIMGYQAITSQVAGTTVALIQPNQVLYADDGGVTIDVSREASVQMDTALDSPPLATTILTSLWQNNLVGLRAERFINWKKARTGCVQYTVATYSA
jgi:HK97 family phage major capsid protein/HK97 family phage prohead protease